LLGILKAGGAYVPMAIDAPAARIAAQLSESGARIVVTTESLAGLLPAEVTVVALDRDAATLSGQPAKAPDVTVGPDNLAYVLYTSGSTGTPKGVAVTHANIVHYARAISRVLAGMPVAAQGDGLGALAGWHIGLASTLAADLGNTSVYPALFGGATLHVLSKETTTQPAQYAAYVAAHPLDLLKITPNHIVALTNNATGSTLAQLLPSKWLVTGGEALSLDVAQSFVNANGCRVLNHYGPTETTVGVCTFEVTDASLKAVRDAGAQTVPVGAPLVNTRAYVVDSYGQPQPIGVPGELWFGGAGVTRGYLNRADLTTERFVAEPGVHGSVAYRTGDRARRLTDGAIEFLGRTDDQVKVRGYRVELGEIEQALARHPSVAQAVVLVATADGAEPALAAYVVQAERAGYAASHAERPSLDTLREWTATQVPDYMVPQSIVFIDAVPLTPNGKVDRRALASLGVASAAAEYVAPRTDTETSLAQVWAEVLKKERVGVTDNFLDLGGHSLMAIRVLGKISKTFGVRLPLRTLFDAPTVEKLSAVIDTERASSTASSTISASSRDAYRVRGMPSSGGSTPSSAS
jgi:amino acid adenylation domain-containing protein